MTTINTINEPTYAEHQAAKAAKKEERAWKKTMAEAKVYDANPLPRYTEAAAADMLMSRLLGQTNAMIKDGEVHLAKFAVKLVASPYHVFEWSREEFDVAGSVKVAKDIQSWINICTEIDPDYRPSTMNVLRGIRERLLNDVIRAARYPERSTSQQSNLIQQSIAAAQAKVLDDMNRWFDFYQVK